MEIVNPVTLASKRSNLETSSTDLLCSICELPVAANARQSVDCGCRICEECYLNMTNRKLTEYECKWCRQPASVDQLFLDKAVAFELKNASFQCYYEGCSWEGSSYLYRDHIKSCKFAVVRCTHLGCDVTIQRKDLKDHTVTCSYKPIVCIWCKNTIPAALKNSHEADSCPHYEISCTLGCGEKVERKKMSKHLVETCKINKQHTCNFRKYGCSYEGTLDELTSHHSTELSKHLELLKEKLDGSVVQSSSITVQSIKEMDRQLSTIGSEITGLKRHVITKFETLSTELARMDKTLQDIQEEYQDLSLAVQVLQATSYDGKFIWKIPEVSRRQYESLKGTTISLFSAPFYTSRFGYKLCLRLYMNGDGSGKGTHLSLFLSIMKGEYDSLLQWPFPCHVTLMLLDQRGQDHITESFNPDPTSSSFWRPQTELNIASGLPRFAPLSVLHDRRYVVDDTIFFKAIIDKHQNI